MALNFIAVANSNYTYFRSIQQDQKYDESKIELQVNLILNGSLTEIICLNLLFYLSFTLLDFTLCIHKYERYFLKILTYVHCLFH